jgi:hypothetical protein
MTAIMPASDSEDELPPGWKERATVDDSVYRRVLCEVGTTDVFFITCLIGCLRKEQALPAFEGGIVSSS